MTAIASRNHDHVTGKMVGIASRVRGNRRQTTNGRPAHPLPEGITDMGIILLVLLLAIILGGLGFAIHVLWWIALAVLVLWLVGFVFRVGEGTSRRRWYRW